MSKFIDTLTVLVGLGVAGYFAYKVVLPKMGGIKKPPVPSSQPYGPPPPPIASSSPIEDVIEELPSTTKKPKATTSPSSGGGTTGGGGTKATAGAGGNTAEKLGYKGTGQKVAISGVSDHENGKRFNCNHKFKNYLIISHIKIGSGQKTLNCKTDGPNHGSCKALPKCCWIEPNLTISNGKLDMTAEFPHPTGHDGRPCPSCKTIGAVSGTIGWAQALYQDGAFRHIDVWTDKSGNGSAWTKIASETDKGQITTPELAKRPLFLEGKGLEAEIRCHGSTGGDAGIKDGWVYEIVPPVLSTAGFVQSFFSMLEAPIPRRYNNR